MVDVMGEEHRVIRLAHARHRQGADPDTKHRVLSSIKLLIVINFILFGAIGTTLLHALLVMDWTHESLLPFNEGDPAPEAFIKIQERVSTSAIQVHPSCQDFSQGAIKC